VDTLANSKVFQRFAVRSNAYFSEVSKKGVEQKEGFAEKSSDFFNAFKEEIRKGYTSPK
jgi:hypothetical protein